MTGRFYKIPYQRPPQINFGADPPDPMDDVVEPVYGAWEVDVKAAEALDGVEVYDLYCQYPVSLHLLYGNYGRDLAEFSLREAVEALWRELLRQHTWPVWMSDLKVIEQPRLHQVVLRVDGVGARFKVEPTFWVESPVSGELHRSQRIGDRLAMFARAAERLNDAA